MKPSLPIHRAAASHFRLLAYMFVSLWNLRIGADFIIHSLTKYSNGHGNALGGAVIDNTKLIDKIKQQSMLNLAGIISPFNAWLIMRGVITLPLRMRQRSESDLKIARFLEKNLAVKSA